MKSRYTIPELIAELRRQRAMRNSTWPCVLLADLMPLCDAVDPKHFEADERAHRIASIAAEELVRCEGEPTNSPDMYAIPVCQADDHMRDCIAHLCHHGLAACNETSDGYLAVQFGDFTLGAG